MMLLACGLIPIFGALLLLLPVFRGRAACGVLVGVGFINLILTAIIAYNRTPGESVYFLNRYLVLDASSLLFLSVVSIVFFGITIYIAHRVSAGLMPDAFGGFIARVLLFMSASILSIISNQLIAMWLFLEFGTLAIAPLIAYARGKIGLDASWKYLLFSIIGLGFNFLGLLCLARAMGGAHGHNGELNFFIDNLQTVPSLGDKMWWELGLAFMVFGLGTKLGLAPMYSWLPDAYDHSPPSITALLSAVQFNCVILCLFREVALLRSFDPTLVSEELLVMGVLSLIIAAMNIITTDNYKRLIAYASLNHAGTIAIGLGIGKSAAYGVVLYVVSNAFVKAVLFLTCGNIKAHYGTKKISELRGLIREMPFSGLSFMLGVFALLGFAPFGSFLGEVVMLSSMIEGPYILVFFLICIILTVVLVASGRALFPMIWGEGEGESKQKREPILSNVATLLFIGVLVSLGVYTPSAVTSLIQEVATTLGGR